MSGLNQWLWEAFGDWIHDMWGLWVILTAALLLVLIIVLIVVAVRHAKNKKTIAALKAKASAAPNEGQLRTQIRAEMEAEYASCSQSEATANDDSAAKIEELDETVKSQQARIKELKAQLEAAQNQKTPDKSDNAGLYRTINELNKRVKAQDEEITRLKTEASAPEPQAEKPKKQTKPAPAPEPEPQDDDDDDYYDDEYGDETSAVKVTLKYDRLKGNWIILRSDSDRTYRRVATKQEALTLAKDLARRLHAQLAVHKKDGKFQKV